MKTNAVPRLAMLGIAFVQGLILLFLYRSIEDSVTNEQEDEGIVTADLIYEYKISESATFKETLLVEDGSENTYTESDTSLTAMINGNLAAKISYLVKRNSDVPAGIDRTDQITTVSLVYSF